MFNIHFLLFLYRITHKGILKVFLAVWNSHWVITRMCTNINTVIPKEMWIFSDQLLAPLRFWEYLKGKKSQINYVDWFRIHFIYLL